MHIGLLAADLSHQSGWAHYSLSLIQALQRCGVELTIIAPQDSPDLAGVKQHRLLPSVQHSERYSLFKTLGQAPQVGRLLRDCDLIHSLIEPYAPLANWISAGRPYLVTAHGSYVDLLSHRRGTGLVYRRAFQHSHLICVSHYTAKVAQAVIPEIAATVIPNGIDLERFAHLPQGVVEKQGPTVLAVGAVKLRKGTLELVRAIARVRESIPNVQCVIIGRLDLAEGYIQQIEAEISVLGLEQQVHLLGHVPEETLLGWYAAADLFALPSLNIGRKFEGFGLAYLEASAAGLPVIGTRDCGAEDAIEPTITGLLIEQSDVTDALPDAIITLLKNPDRAARMGAAGRERAQHFTWDHSARQLLEVYQKVIAR